MTLDEPDSVPTAVQIVGEAAANAAPFGSEAFNLSSRPMTTAAVTWDPIPVWSGVGTHQTPSLATIVQEIVNGSGWAAGQAMVLVLSGTGERTAVSYDGDPLAAPGLHVEYQ